MRWTGTATLVFSDGETTWMTDGWFSRPGPLAAARSARSRPTSRRSSAGSRATASTQLAAVFPVHSHYDHAMDAPEVARRTGALLLGSESTANIGRGWGLAERQIRVVRDRELILLGKFLITPIASRHFEFPDPRVRERALGDPDITEPLVPPAGAFAYKVGRGLGAARGASEGQLARRRQRGLSRGRARRVTPPTPCSSGSAGSARRPTTIARPTGARRSSARTRARIIPIHWDSLTAPIEGPFRGPLRAEAFLSRGSDARSSS